MKNSVLSKKLGVCWKIRLFLENQALSGKLDAFWKIRRFLENQALSGKSGTSLKNGALLRKLVHLSQKHCTYKKYTMVLVRNMCALCALHKINLYYIL